MKDVVKRVYFAEIWDSHGNLQWKGDTPFDLGEVPAQDFRVGNYDWSSLSEAEQEAFLAATSGFGAVEALEDDALDVPAARASPHRADVPVPQWQSVQAEDAMLGRALATKSRRRWPEGQAPPQPEDPPPQPPESQHGEAADHIPSKRMKTDASMNVYVQEAACSSHGCLSMATSGDSDNPQDARAAPTAQDA